MKSFFMSWLSIWTANKKCQWYQQKHVIEMHKQWKYFVNISFHFWVMFSWLSARNKKFLQYIEKLISSDIRLKCYNITVIIESVNNEHDAHNVEADQVESNTPILKQLLGSLHQIIKAFVDNMLEVTTDSWVHAIRQLCWEIPVIV